MATRADVGRQPKKRLITYGKGSRRSIPSRGYEILKSERPSSSASELQNPLAKSSTAAPSELSPPAGKLEKRLGQSNGHENDTGTAQEQRECAAVSLWDVPDEGEDIAPAKKRKLGIASPSAIRKVEQSVYSPPSSPRSPLRSVQTPSKGIDLGVSKSTRQPKRSSHAPHGNGLSAKDASSIHPEASVDWNAEHKQQPIPIRSPELGRPQPRSSIMTAREAKVAARKLPEPAAPPTGRKKRLIDELVAQVEDDSEEEPPSQDAVITPASSSPTPPLVSSPGLLDQPKPRTLPRQHSMPKKAGPKFTYSQQRTMLAEDPLLDAAGLGGVEDQPGKAPFLGLGAMMQSSTLSTFSFLDEEDDTSNSGAVRSLHELRQAGANSRFSDEMDDILDRIGSPASKPSSLRRGALLELAQKMKDKNFRRQFRNNSGGDGALFSKLGQETDIIAGFAILSILTTLLSASTSPHTIQKLKTEGIAQLLTQVLAVPADISAVAKDRKRNVSKNGQSTLSTIKSAMLELPIWEPLSPIALSPRTLALKALDLILRQSTDLESEAAVFTPAVTDFLFSILSSYANPACWEPPSQPESVDFYLALYILETYAVSAMQSHHGSRWTSEYLPIVADVLETALRRPIDQLNDLEGLALRLTLNTTNNNTEAAQMFVKRGILRDLAEAACKTFEVVLKSITDDSFMSKVLESLIFMLGVKINFCEHYIPAAQSLYELDDDAGSPLDRLIRVFLDYHSTTSDADSMEKTQLNVAFGYLSTLLGYLCLYSPIRDRFISIYSKGSLEPLLDSLREFILFHRVAARGMEVEGSSNPQANAALRLQLLVDQLESGH